MVDENKLLDTINLIKKITIVILILGFALFFGYKFLNKQNTSKIENYLKENGYKEIYNGWYKENSVNNDDQFSVTKYLYDPNINKFLKETIFSNNYYKEELSIRYNGTDNFDASYNYINTDENCNLNLSATYNYKKKKFKCSVESNPNKCELKCNVLKQEFEKFDKELNEIMKKSGTNESFLSRDKDYY